MKIAKRTTGIILGGVAVAICIILMLVAALYLTALINNTGLPR